MDTLFLSHTVNINQNQFFHILSDVRRCTVVSTTSLRGTANGLIARLAAETTSRYLSQSLPFGRGNKKNIGMRRTVVCIVDV